MKGLTLAFGFSLIIVIFAEIGEKSGEAAGREIHNCPFCMLPVDNVGPPKHVENDTISDLGMSAAQRRAMFKAMNSHRFFKYHHSHLHQHQHQHH